jgi:hypothetical protein
MAVSSNRFAPSAERRVPAAATGAPIAGYRDARASRAPRWDIGGGCLGIPRRMSHRPEVCRLDVPKWTVTGTLGATCQR